MAKATAVHALDRHCCDRHFEWHCCGRRRHLSSDTALAVALLAIELGTKQAAIPFLGKLMLASGEEHLKSTAITGLEIDRKSINATLVRSLRQKRTLMQNDSGYDDMT